MSQGSDTQSHREQYAARRRNQRMLGLVLLMLALGVTLVRDPEAGTMLGVPVATMVPVLFVVVVAAVAFSFRNWRCPACRAYLGRKFNPRHCPGCGAELHG